MWNRANTPDLLVARRQELLEKSYELLSSRSIDSVAMQDIADYVGCGIATVYRYFRTKQILVISVAVWRWEKFKEINPQRRQKSSESMSAAEFFEFYLDSFLEMYRKHRDLLRFNQFFNVYVESEDIDPEVLKPYQEMIKGFGERFHVIYEKALQDHTIRTDMPEEEMFSTTLHLMLAAVTRYAVGLVYRPENGFDPEKELELQKKIMLQEFKA